MMPYDRGAPGFMAGYKRDHVLTMQLENAVAAALRAHPNQRLGQIIANYVLPPGSDLGDLFNVFDEDMVEGLEKAARA